MVDKVEPAILDKNSLVPVYILLAVVAAAISGSWWMSSTLTQYRADKTNLAMGIKDNGAKLDKLTIKLDNMVEAVEAKERRDEKEHLEFDMRLEHVEESID